MSRGSVVSALDFQTLILGSIPVEVSLSALSFQPKSLNKNFSIIMCITLYPHIRN